MAIVINIRDIDDFELMEGTLIDTVTVDSVEAAEALLDEYTNEYLEAGWTLAGNLMTKSFAYEGGGDYTLAIETFEVDETTRKWTRIAI